MDISKVQPINNHLKLVGEFLKARGTRPELEISSMPILNKKMWGVGRKKLTIIGARPSQGKSALAMQIAWDISQTNKVLVLSLEQTVEESIERMFCNVQKVNNVSLLQGGFDRYQPEWEEFCVKANSANMIVTESIGKTWQEIDYLINTLEEYPDLIVLDYIQCISTKGLKKLEAIDEYILHLRNLAIEHNFGIILCSQISRANVDGQKEPTLTGLKSTGYLEELGDKILLLHWEAHSNPNADLNKFKIILAKNKGGRTGHLMVKFEPEYYKFSDSETVDDDNVNEVKELFKGDVCI